MIVLFASAGIVIALFPLTPTLSLGGRERAGLASGGRSPKRRNCEVSILRWSRKKQQAGLDLCEAGVGEFIEPAGGIVSGQEPGVGRVARGWIMAELERNDH
jgi:hypothetical protein